MKFSFGVLLFTAATAMAMPNPELEDAPLDIDLSDAVFEIPDVELDIEGIEKRDGPAIVRAAQSQKGVPYVWGGGGCNGKSKGGFDCSGLTQYAVCQGQKKTIPRNSQAQYNAVKQGRRIPRAQAAAGDLLFWAKNGNCNGGVNHVGIFVRPGVFINAATTGTPVREQKIYLSSGSQKICPSAMRFW